MSEDSFCAGRIVNNRMMLKALKNYNAMRRRNNNPNPTQQFREASIIGKEGIDREVDEKCMCSAYRDDDRPEDAELDKLGMNVTTPRQLTCN